MNGIDLEKELFSRCPGLTTTDIRDAVSAIPAAFNSPVPSEVVNPSAVAVSSDLSIGETPSGNGSEANATSNFNYPECFRCYIDIDGAYQVESPVVCLPDGSRIEATGAESISGQGSYFCKVTKTSSDSETTYAAEITTEEDSGSGGGEGGEGESTTRTIAVVPIFSVNGKGEILQKHIGAIIITGGSGYDPADNSGLVINDSNELDLSGREESDEFAVHEVTKKNSSGESETVAKVLSTADIELAAGVESLNGSTGVMYIIGGEHIRVETDRQTIKISYDEDKEEEDEDPQPDPKKKKKDCEHPGDDEDDGGVHGGGGGGGGGVPADGDTHVGDNDCCGKKAGAS